MAVVPYFATYARFVATEKGEGALLMGADCLVGDELSLVFDREDKGVVVWLENRFGGRCGKLEPSATGHVQLCQAKGWDTHVLLASVYGMAEEYGMGYWGEVVIIAYPHSNAEAFDVFTKNIGSMLAQGVRPQVELQQSSLTQILETNGTWKPSGRVAPLKPEGSALVKGQITFNEQMIEMARDRNIGCMIAGWLFIALLVVGAFFLVRLLMGV